VHPATCQQSVTTGLVVGTVFVKVVHKYTVCVILTSVLFIRKCWIERCAATQQTPGISFSDSCSPPQTPSVNVHCKRSRASCSQVATALSETRRSIFATNRTPRKYDETPPTLWLNCSEAIAKEKVKVRTLNIAPLRETPPQKCWGMAYVLKGSHSFTCTTTRSSAIGMSHTCLCLLSYSWYFFTDPGGMDRRLSWRMWLVTWWDSLPARRQSPISLLTGLNVEQLRWSRLMRYRYTKKPMTERTHGLSVGD